MLDPRPEIIVSRLARGFTDVFDQIVADGRAVQQDASLPASTRRGLTLLSGLCAAERVEDWGASLHEVMAKASQPFRDWGLAAFQPPFRYADVALVDPDLGVPTADCRELAHAGDSEISAQEELHHEHVRLALKDYPPRQRAEAYTAIRGFVVRHPAVHEEDIHRFIVEGGHAASARTIMSFYRPIPQAALQGGRGIRCAKCGSILWPERDAVSFPSGRCRIRQCRLACPVPAKRDVITEPGLWRLATNAILAYWVGPGLDEIHIYDSLATNGKRVALYPQADAADIGIDGLAIGIDVKTYASPVVLAAKLSRSIGRLEMFRRKILAVPDDKLRLNPHYLAQLRASYQGSQDLEFMTVSEAIREFSR